VTPLTGEARIHELATMLGAETEPNLQSAAELLLVARQKKQPSVAK